MVDEDFLPPFRIEDRDPVTIAGRPVGPHHSTLVVAEVGVNHNCDPELGLRIIDAAAAAGADAVKFQSYRADRIASRTCPLYWGGKEASQYEVFSKLDRMRDEDLAELLRYARRRHGLIAFSTPFDLEAVDFLESQDVPCYKIASADLTYTDLLVRVARTGAPVILSTGASSVGEIEGALRTLEGASCREIVILGCTLNYPTALQDANLSQIRSMAGFFRWPIGYSDHTESTRVPGLAVALGASMIEKHFTLDRSLKGSPDHRLSADPAMLAQVVANVREAELAVRGPGKRVLLAEAPARRYARRSWVAVQPVKAGTVLEPWMFAAKRPGTGIPPNEKPWGGVLDVVALVDIEEDQVLEWPMVGARQLASSNG